MKPAFVTPFAFMISPAATPVAYWLSSTTSEVWKK